MISLGLGTAGFLLAALPSAAQQATSRNRSMQAPDVTPKIDYTRPFVSDAVPLGMLPTLREQDRTLPVDVYTFDGQKPELRNAEPIPAPAPQPNARKQPVSPDFWYDSTYEKNFNRLAPGGLGPPDQRP